MSERPVSAQSPSDNDPVSTEGRPGTYLKEVDEDTDASGVDDESDGMPETDFLGKSNLRNRDKESEDRQ